MNFQAKEARNLTVGDMILHPIYRKDGLLLIDRFTKITIPLLKHLLIHCEENLPILVTTDALASQAHIDDNMTMDKELLLALRKLHDQHRKQFYIRSNIAAYVGHTMESIAEISKPAGLIGFDDSISIKKIMIRLFTNPLWTNLDRTVLSPEIASRTLKVKRNILQVIQDDPTIPSLLNRLITYNDSLTTHSINSMISALAIGLTVELTEVELTHLAFAALFADIGYTCMTVQKFSEILDSRQLAEYIEGHIRDTIDLIKDSSACRDKSIILGILDHHEHYDGSGFPIGKKNRQISLFGQIIAIAKTYDESVGSYFSEASSPIIQAQSVIWEERGIKWDPNLLGAYMHRRNYCKIGHKVIFKDGQQGEIIGFSDFINEPLHPIVQLPSGNKRDFHSTRDLSIIHSIQAI